MVARGQTGADRPRLPLGSSSGASWASHCHPSAPPYAPHPHPPVAHPQAEAVRRYAIIVSAHGSHSVGLAYIRPCTVLLELLSPSWLLPLFSGLAVSVSTPPQ